MGKEKNKERQRQVQEKYQRLKQDREKQKQRKKKQIQDDDDDDTVMTELTQESSVDNREFGCHLIDGEENNKNDTNIVTTTTQVLF